MRIVNVYYYISGSRPWFEADWRCRRTWCWPNSRSRNFLQVLASHQTIGTQSNEEKPHSFCKRLEKTIFIQFKMKLIKQTLTLSFLCHSFIIWIFCFKKSLSRFLIKWHNNYFLSLDLRTYKTQFEKVLIVFKVSLLGIDIFPAR